MKMMMGGLLGAALMSIAMPATAAVTLQVENGKLVSATGVVIGKSTYKVTFADNSCNAVFGSCIAARFDFKTEEAALAAGNALLSQVLIGSYRSNPGSVFGCSTSACDTYIPYKIYDDDPGYAQAVVVGNRGPTNRFVRGTVYPGVNESTAFDPNVNYARFTLQAAAVPEPATWAMMMLGLGMVAGTARYRRRNTRIVYA